MIQGIFRPCAASQSAYQSSRANSMVSASAADRRRSSLFVPIDRQRMTRMRENPGVGKLLQRCRVVTSRDALCCGSQARCGGMARIKDSPAGERTPCHRQHAQFLALMKRAVVDRLRMQQVKLNLVRDE